MLKTSAFDADASSNKFLSGTPAEEVKRLDKSIGLLKKGAFAQGKPIFILFNSKTGSVQGVTRDAAQVARTTAALATMAVIGDAIGGVHAQRAKPFFDLAIMAFTSDDVPDLAGVLASRSIATDGIDLSDVESLYVVQVPEKSVALFVSARDGIMWGHPNMIDLQEIRIGLADGIGTPESDVFGEALKDAVILDLSYLMFHLTKLPSANPFLMLDAVTEISGRMLAAVQNDVDFSGFKNCDGFAKALNSFAEFAKDKSRAEEVIKFVESRVHRNAEVEKMKADASLTAGKTIH